MGFARATVRHPTRVCYTQLMKILYLMQGIPGSGKTTIAQMIQDCERANGKRVALLSTDDWRFDDDENYVFDPKDNERYHIACQQECAKKMVDGIECIIIDNTNIQEWQAHPYLVLASIFEYVVQVVSVDSGLNIAIERQKERRQDRQVPTPVIIDMYDRMERLLAPPRDVLMTMLSNATISEAKEE